MTGISRCLILSCLAVSLGCTTSSTSNTARTSTEQLLVSNAIDRSLDKVNFNTFSGYNVFLQDKYVDCVDKNYVIASTRHRLMACGARLVDSADAADVVVELRSGAIGTASQNSFIGTPEVTLPGMMAIPEVRLVERKRQEGIAKIGLVAYNPQTREVLGIGGQSLARSDDNNWFVAGVGPYQSGTLKSEIQRSTTGSNAAPPTRTPPAISFVPPNDNTLPKLAAEEPELEAVSPASHSDGGSDKASAPKKAPSADWAGHSTW